MDGKEELILRSIPWQIHETKVFPKMAVYCIASPLSAIISFLIVVVTELEKVALDEEALVFTDAFVLFQFE